MHWGVHAFTHKLLRDPVNHMVDIHCQSTGAATSSAAGVAKGGIPTGDATGVTSSSMQPIAFLVDDQKVAQ